MAPDRLDSSTVFGASQRRERLDASTVAALLAGFIAAYAIVFSVLPGGLEWNRAADDVDAVGGSLFRQLQWLPVFALAGLVVWWRRSETRTLLRASNPYLLLFVVWATATMLWSPYPGVTFRKLWSLYGVILLSIAFQVAGWTPDRFAAVLRNALFAMLLLSLLLIALWPQLGVHPDGPHAGVWRGAVDHKNGLGAMAGLAFVAWLHAWLTRSASRPICVTAVLVSLLLLIGSRSMTALITTAVTTVVLTLLLRPPVTGRHVLPAFVLVSAIAAIALGLVLYASGDALTSMDLLGPVMELFGRDVGLTGRDDIWDLVLAEFRQHWLLGYGYNTFWLGDAGPSARIADVLYWTPWQAHNGYIDILNETGVIGMAIVTAFMLRHLAATFRLSVFDRHNGALHLALLLMVVIRNLSESTLFAGLSIYWIILALSSMSVARALMAGPDGTQSSQLWARDGLDRPVRRTVVGRS